MRRLARVAATMGLRLHGAYLPDGRLGYYSPDEARIYFDMRLAPIERRSVIAHELGHAHHGHLCDSDGNDRQADVFAARLLIDPIEYARLERVDPDQHQLADELGVTPELVFTYEAHCLTRVRGVTYALPRMGVNQWAYRSAHA